MADAFRDPDRCPLCGEDSLVIESRSRSNCRWRLRVCRQKACGHRWDTFELTVDPDELQTKIPISSTRAE